MRVRVLLTISFVILLLGCGSPDEKFIGEYVVSLEISQETIDNIISQAPPGVGIDEEFIKREARQMSAVLYLDPDGVASISMYVENQQEISSGTWELSSDGSEIFLFINEGYKAQLFGVPDSDTEGLILEVQEDESVLIRKASNGSNSVTMIFTKV